MASTKKIKEAECTYIMNKPDGVQRGPIADIMKRFEQRGYKLISLKMIQVIGMYKSLKHNYCVFVCVCLFVCPDVH